MKTEVILIDNKKARLWLKRNTDNRPLRRAKVNAFHDAYRCGELRLTHQGVAFDVNGVLKDGQHRLTFISELPDGVTVPMNVTTGMEVDTFGAIDRGAVRTASDEMRIGNSLSAIAALLAKVYNLNQGHSWSLQYLQRFVDFAQPGYEEIYTYCSTSAQVWSSAPVRAAAIVQIEMGSDADFVKSTYRSLVMSDFANMPLSAQALVRQHMSGKIVSSRGIDLFCRALRVFDSKKKQVTRIQIGSATQDTKEVREFLFSRIDAPKLTKKDPRQGGSKGVKPSLDSTSDSSFLNAY